MSLLTKKEAWVARGIGFAIGAGLVGVVFVLARIFGWN